MADPDIRHGATLSHLQSELRTISLPPPPSLPITTHQPPPGPSTQN